MAFKWPWQKEKQIEERGINDIPDKVFIERENQPLIPNGRAYEYSIDDPRISGPISNLLYGYYAPQNFIELFYTLPEIFAPVHEIASRVADCNWQLRKIRKTGGDHNDEPIYNNEQFNRLFSQPNPLISFKQFIYQAVCYEILTGRQFFYFNRPDSLLLNPLEATVNWWNLPAHKVTAELKTDIDPYTATTIGDFVRQYREPISGKDKIFPPDKVATVFHPNLRHPRDINQSKSLLAGAEKAIRNLIPVYEARGFIYIKRGALGFLVSRKADETGTISLTTPEKERVRKDVLNTYGITAGKDPIGITDVPLEFIQTGMSISDLEPFAETEADAIVIYKCLRVPDHLVPRRDRSTFNNAAADMKSFYSDVIIPWAGKYAEIFTNALGLRDSRTYIYPDYSHVDVLQENKKEKAEVDKTTGIVYLQRFQYGVCTLNDWVTANGETKVNSPLYDKKIFEMTPDELEIIKNALNLKVNVATSENTTGESTGRPN